MPRNDFLLDPNVLIARRDAVSRFQRQQAQLISRQREQREQERVRPESQRVAEVRPESQPGIIESQPGIIERLSEAFAPQQAGRNSYYDEAQSNSFLQASSRIASGVHPIAGWLANGIGAGLLAGVSSANPFIGLAAGGASLISGIPSLWSGLRDRRAQQERAERERRRSDALIEASNRVKQLNERYNSLMQALQGMKGNTNVVNSNPELVAERVNEGKVASDAERKAQAVTDPIRRYNNLQIQRAASFSVFPIPPIVPKRALVRPAAPDRRLVRPMSANFFSIL